MPKRSSWILIAIIFVSFYATLGYYPLFNLDEGAFSEATREMLASGNFITTYLNGDLRFDKPILIYWLQAVSASLFGLNEFAMRLPSAIAATIWALLIYRFSKRFFDEQTAFWATLFMVGSLQISIIAKAAIADALLNMFIASSMFCFYLYSSTKEKKYLYATFAFIGFGTLTKGPVAILIPLAVSFLFLIKNVRFWLKSVFNPVGIVIFVLIAAPWYLAEYFDQGEKFIQGFLLKHNLSRFAGKAMEGHAGSIFYYIPIMLIGLLPFTSIFIKSLQYIKNWLDSPVKRYLAIWFLFVFIFFSFSHTKLPHYIIYGYTPLFILMALFFQKMQSNFWLLFPFNLFNLLFFSLPFFRKEILSTIKRGSYEYYIVQGLHFGWDYILFFGLSLLTGIFLLRTSKEKATIIAAFLTVIGLNFFVAKVYADAAENPIKEAALFAKKQGFSVVMDGINAPSFAFYLYKITPKRAPKNGEIVFTKRNHMKAYKNFDILFEKNGVALLQIKENK